MQRTILLCAGGSFLMAFAGALLAVTLAMPHPVGAQAVGPGSGATGRDEHLAGSWLLTTTAGSHVGTTTALVTFNDDGTLTESTFGGRPEVTLTTGHGVWVRTGDHTYAITLFRLVRLAPGDQNLERVQATLTLNATSDGVSGPIETDTFDEDGNISATVAAAAEATRMAVVPMQ